MKQMNILFPNVETQCGTTSAKFSRDIHSDHLVASEKQHTLQWDDFMKEQPNKRAEVDEEHRKAMGRLKEQYAEMEKDLAKFSTF